VQQVVSHQLALVLVQLLLKIHLQFQLKVLVQLLLKIHLQFQQKVLVLVQLQLRIHLHFQLQVQQMRQLQLVLHKLVLEQLLVLQQLLVGYILVLRMGHFNKDLGFLYKLVQVSNFPKTRNYKLSLNTNILLHQSIIQLQFHSHNLNRTNTNYQLLGPK